MKAIEDHLGIHPGQTTADGVFTFSEVECLGACVNAPMVQINDDYFEDLTPETTVTLLKALQASAESGADRPQWDLKVEEAIPRTSSATGIKMPPPGPLSGRETCENSAGLTNLTSEPWGKEKLRTDGAL
jgi:NADH dehydrogenase (ubiquinone) flavoprotein 2